MQIPRVFVKVQDRELTAVREFRLFTDFISLCHFQLSRAPFQYEIIGYRQYVKAVASFPKENRLHTPTTRFCGGRIWLPVCHLLLVLFTLFQRDNIKISFICLNL